jgi:tRNA uridine 5-carboxymethylaminomethyl modification enzyme
LKELGLELGRLKTGTPPRILKSSIDFSSMELQPGDDPIPYFSYWKEDLFHVEHSGARPKYPRDSILERHGQLPCYLTHTTESTGAIVRSNLHKSPMYSGVIEGVGPRYCPSIEDKFVRFPDKPLHQVFLEPEGVATDEMYVNGLSTCLPFDVQLDLVRSVKGCERAEIMRPAYAVEYDFAFPTQLNLSLETKVCRNLFLAGQINGTSGYEEAGAQGIIAGINAARRTQSLSPVVLGRDQAYIGVLIDDLVTKGTTEPYRMFTSRAEYRLLLRQDNADLRLSEQGFEIGLLPQSNYTRFRAKQETIGRELIRLEETRTGKHTLGQLLRRPEIAYSQLPSQDISLSPEVIQQVEIAVKYSGYIDRQELEVSKLKALEKKLIPETFDYQRVLGLRTEARQKLTKLRPQTIGQAARVSGISPADIGLVLCYLRRGSPAEEPSEPLLPNETGQCDVD